MKRARLITVCGDCLRASCWHGEFMCDTARKADVVQKTAAQLRALKLENPYHWSRTNVEKICGYSEWTAP